MAFEYFLYGGCPLQESLDTIKFMRAAKIKDSLEYIDAFRADWDGTGMHPDERTMVFDYEVDTLEGPMRKVPVRLLRASYREMIAQEAMETCGDCPLNLGQDLLGCYGAIQYPISPAAEQWLVGQFNPPDGEFGYLPIHIRDNGLTGQEIDRRRPRPGDPPRGLFAAPQPARKRLGAKGPEFTSSQVLQYLLACMPALRPVTMFGLCVDFHAIEISEEELVDYNYRFSLEDRIGPEEFEKVEGDFREQLMEVPFRMKPGDDEEPSIQQFKNFFLACWAGCCMGTSLFIDG